MIINNKVISQVIFFIVVFIVGIAVYRDYGISWDEPASRLNGLVSANYIAQKFQFIEVIRKQQINMFSLDTYIDKDYGVIFELPAVVFEKLLKLKDSRDIYMFRHLLTFIVFIFGLLAIYKLASERFDSWKIGLFAALLLFLTPRIFAESFYNSKDIVFMVAFAAALNTMISFLVKPSFKTAVLHGLVTAVAIDIRIMGLLIPVTCAAVMILKYIKKEYKLSLLIKWVFIYFTITVFFIVLMWPWLWMDQYGNFIQAFKNMSKFRWDNYVLYMGTFIKATNIPWHYSLVWIGITVPPIYIFFH